MTRGSYLRLALICLLAARLAMESAQAGTSGPEAEFKALVPKAQAVVKPWQDANTKAASRTLHIVYWTPADRPPAPRYEERLTAILRDIQAFYALQMQRLGFGPLTFDFDSGPDRSIRIILVKGAQPYAHYELKSGREIREECLPALREAGLDAEHETIVIFANMANWDPATRRITQNSPYYASGNTRSGTAWQVDSPILELAALTNKADQVQDGQYGRISLGRYNSIFIGGIAHEMGHALGLPHDRERASERVLWGSELMGSGNRTYGEERRGDGRGSYLTLANGLRLLTHPLFCGRVPNRPVKDELTMEQLKFTPGDRTFACSGQVKAAVPVYAVLGYLDPAGGGDYDAVTCVAIPDAGGRFTLTSPPLNAGERGMFRLIALGADGSASSFATGGSENNFPYRVTAAGQPDLLMAQLRLDLAPALKAVNEKNTNALAGVLEQLGPKYQGQSLFNELGTALAAVIQPPAPVDPAQAAGPELLLSQARPTQAKVGWLRPAYDRVPDSEVLLGCDGDLFAHGIYAHAPARHVYELGKRWQTLAGKAGLAEGKNGSVVFVIEGDGRELWRSPLVKSGSHSFKVSLKEVQQLVLRVEDGGDGASNDWGLWLNPLLSR